MIELRDVNKEFINHKMKIIALNNINCSFDGGKFYAIMGSSGSGKSTLLNMIGLLDKPTSGNIIINNINIRNYNEKDVNMLRMKKIGFVFQDCFLSENLNVYENVILPLLINNDINMKEKHERVLQLLKMLNLNNRIEHYPKELSGGECQRVSIARALVNNPDIIIADEPTGNLDKLNEENIFNFLKQLARIGKCVIVVSHSELIKKYADKVLYMNNGKLRGDNYKN